MYQRGDYVVKVPEGVCKIEEIGQFDISGTDREYYLLVPIAEQSSRIYVPTDNAAGRIRSLQGSLEKLNKMWYLFCGNEVLPKYCLYT